MVAASGSSRLEARTRVRHGDGGNNIIIMLYPSLFLRLPWGRQPANNLRGHSIRSSNLPKRIPVSPRYTV